MKKAIFIGKTRDKHNAYLTYLFYVYRGQQYMVVDYENGYSESLSTQHNREQKHIDEMIERKSEPIKEYSNAVEDAINMLYEYWES